MPAVDVPVPAGAFAHQAALPDRDLALVLRDLWAARRNLQGRLRLIDPAGAWAETFDPAWPPETQERWIRAKTRLAYLRVEIRAGLDELRVRRNPVDPPPPEPEPSPTTAGLDLSAPEGSQYLSFLLEDLGVV